MTLISLLAICLISLAPTALAQDGGGDGGAGSTSGTSSQGGASGQIELSSTTTAKEKMSYADEAMVEMRAVLKEINRRLEQAEKERDVVKVQCLKPKASAVALLVQAGEEANTLMRQQLASAQDSRADHEFRKIAVALAKVRQFAAESEGCMGQAGVLTTGNDSPVDGDNSALETVDGVDDVGGLDAGVDPPQGSPFN